uniref:MIF4G domain-containing protein n=1 Tax=Ascaris lumbricoides TaxID=6252 RepID=A0A9J2Q3E2_ASCLU
MKTSLNKKNVSDRNLTSGYSGSLRICLLRTFLAFVDRASNEHWTPMNEKGEKVRSKEDEEALDRKIAEIRKKNELIARRKEEVDKDRETFASETGELLQSPAKEPQKTGSEKPAPTKNTKGKEWDREWDAGKTSADTWKENVPEMGRSLRGGYGGHSLWSSQQRGRGRGRGRGTPRSEFALHDDRSEPKSKPERHITPTDASHSKVSVANDTAQKNKATEKKQQQGSTPQSEKPHNIQHQRYSVQSADRRKSANQSQQTIKEDGKTKKDGEKRIPKNDGVMKNSSEKSERGQGRGAAVGANRMGRGVHAERVTATKNNSSKTTGSSKRINEKKNATHDKLDTVTISNVKSSSKQPSWNGLKGVERRRRLAGVCKYFILRSAGPGTAMGGGRGEGSGKGDETRAPMCLRKDGEESIACNSISQYPISVSFRLTIMESSNGEADRLRPLKTVVPSSLSPSLECTFEQKLIDVLTQQTAIPEGLTAYVHKCKSKVEECDIVKQVLDEIVQQIA